MPSILTHSRLPLWAYIIIIAIGSVLVLTGLLVIGRCWYIRKCARRSPGRTALQTPTRRVTLRRGRLVPASDHESLTGSRFGLHDFEHLAGGAAGTDPRARSRSPFEWWATVMDRSQSRQSEMSQAGPNRPIFRSQLRTPEPSHPSPLRTHRVLGPSSSSPEFTARQQVPGSPNLKVLKTPSLSRQRPTTKTNFSRAFASRKQPDMAISPSTLEAGPSHGLRDTQRSNAPQPDSSNMDNASNISTRGISAHEEAADNLTPLRQAKSFLYSPSASSSTLPASQGGSGARVSHDTLRQLSQSHSRSSLRQPRQASRLTAESRPATDPTKQNETLSHSRPQASLCQTALPISQSLGSPPIAVTANKEPPSSSQSRDSRRQNLQGRPPSAPLPQSKPVSANDETSTNLPTEEEVANVRQSQYWSTRPDLRPVRKSSKKGNVLRKKSLRRAEIAATVGS